MMLSREDVGLAVVGAPVVAASAYLAMLALAARRADVPQGMGGLAFDVIVPAYNEEAAVETTLSSLRAMEYPPHKFRVVVVADNCDDRTADRARAAGAVVWERHEPEHRGKGYALAFAFASSLADGWADAVVVVDADSIASSNLLSAFAARIIGGADCVQADYGVRNPDSSWRTRLTRIAFALYHTVRSLGRERLGLSCGLRGNGMGFTTDVLRRVPYAAFSLVEDVEYGLALGVAGVRVAYVPEAVVLGDMPVTGDAARVQRQRWEMGRRGLLGQYVPTLLRAALTQRSMIPLDLAADILVPPLTTLAAASLAGTMTAAALWWYGVVGPLGLGSWAVSDLALMIYVCRGCALVGTGSRTAADLLWAPLYATWKLTLRTRPARRRGWVRTRREGER